MPKNNSLYWTEIGPKDYHLVPCQIPMFLTVEVYINLIAHRTVVWGYFKGLDIKQKPLFINVQNNTQITGDVVAFMPGPKPYNS
jgi:hypothetical protein